MCYCLSASLTADPPSDSVTEVPLSTWPAQVRAVSQEHFKLCDEIFQAGKYYKGIERDPRDDTTPDGELRDLRSLNAAYKPGLNGLNIK